MLRPLFVAFVRDGPARAQTAPVGAFQGLPCGTGAVCDDPTLAVTAGRAGKL